MIKNVIKISLAYLTFVLLISIGIYFNIKNQAKSEIKLKEENAVGNLNGLIAKMAEQTISDAVFLAKQTELFLENNPDSFLYQLQETYLQYSQAKQYYDQIRYISYSGTEKVRINFKDNKASVVHDSLLQNKLSRYYFRHTFELNRGEVYFSPFDLNIENGEVELPYNPVIRIGVPVFSPEGETEGVIVLNYLGQNIIDEIDMIDENTFGKMLLINKSGYYIKGLTSDDEWGFMFDYFSTKKFDTNFPDECGAVLNKNKGYVETEKGMFAFQTIYLNMSNVFSVSSFKQPLSIRAKVVGIENHHWRLISYVSQESFVKFVYSKLSFWLKLVLISLIPVLLLIWYLSKSIQQKREANVIIEKKKRKIRKNVKELESLNMSLVYKNKEIKKNTDKVSALSKTLTQMNKKVRSRDEQLNELSKTKERFYSIVSNDLKSTFNSVYDFSELLAKNHDKYNIKKQESIINLLHTSAKNTNNLLNDLMIWSESQLQTLPYNPVSFDIKELVDDVISVMNEKAEFKKINLQNFILHSQFVFGDLHMISVVLNNLISNGIKYTHPKGRISILVGDVQYKDSIEIIVKDTGIGMSANKINNLFAFADDIEPIDENRQSKGLGLIICKDLIERHGSNISVTSNENVGSIFKFSLKKWHAKNN